MSYLYAVRFVAPFTPITYSLRQELYVEPYESINWSAQRNNINALDVYSPHHPIFSVAYMMLNVYESIPSLPLISSLAPVRQKAIDAAYGWVVREDENTTYQTIGPVSKSLNMLCRFHREGRDSDAFKMHLTRVDDFLWLCRDGLFMTGTNGSQLWDLAFVSQAIVETGLANEADNKTCVKGMLDWLDKAQIRENPKHYKTAYRHRTKGAWGFSTPEQGYTVSTQSLPDLTIGVGLFCRGLESRHCAPVAELHPQTHQSGPNAGLHRHYTINAKPQRRLCKLRAHARQRMDGSAQRFGGVRGYHGGLPLPRVHHIRSVRAGALPQD